MSYFSRDKGQQQYQPRFVRQPTIFDKPFIEDNRARNDKIIFRELQAGLLTGSLQAIKSILSNYDGSLNVRDTDQNTLLHIVLKQEKTILTSDDKYSLVEYLIMNNVPITKNSHNITPLHLACKYQYEKIIKLLINKGADVNAVDDYKMTPLHYLVRGNIDKCAHKQKIKEITGRVIIKSDTKNINEIGEVLIALLSDNSGSYKQYIKHINNIIYSIDKIFENEFTEKIKKFTVDYVKKLADNKNNQKTIDELIIAKIEDLNKVISDKLKKTIEDNIKIDPYFVDDNNNKGIDPTENPDNDPMRKIMLNDVTYIQNFTTQTKLKIDNSITSLKQMSNDILKNIQKSDSNIILAFNKIHDILHLNESLKINGFDTVDPTKSLNMSLSSDQLNNIILYPNKNIDFKSPDVTNEDGFNMKYHTTADDILPKYSKLNIPRVDSKLYKTNPTNFPNTYDITDDSTILATSHAYLLGKKLRVGVGPVINVSPLKDTYTINGVAKPDISIYFISPLYNYLQRIVYYWKNCENNLLALYDHITQNEPYYGQTYNYLLTFIIIDIINICTCIRFTLVEKDNVIYRHLHELKNKFDGLQNSQTSALGYIYTWIIEYISEIETKISEAYQIFGKIYDSLVNLIGKLNELIDNINTEQSNRLITEFNKNFLDKTITINSIYNLPLKKINSLPKDIQSYSEKFFLNNQINKKDLVEYFILHTSDKYPLAYYTPSSSTATITPKRPFDDTNINFDFDEQKQNNGFLFDNKPFLNEIKPVIPDTDTVDTVGGEIRVVKGPAIFNKDTEYKQDTSTEILLNINNKIDDHIYLIKHNIIKNLIKEINIGQDANSDTPIIKSAKKIQEDIKNKFSINDEKTIRIIFNVVLGKLIHKLLVQYIKMIVKRTCDEIIRNTVKNISISTKQYLAPDAKIYNVTDTGYQMNLNEIYDDIIEYIINNPSIAPNMYQSNLEIIENNIKDDNAEYNHPVYDYAYNHISDDKCYKFTPKIVDLLYAQRCKINQPDETGSTPLYYAIESQSLEMVEKLISLGATINNLSSTNLTNITPYSYAKILYIKHINKIYEHNNLSNLQNVFCKPYYDHVIDTIKSTFDHNNVIRHLDIMYPTLLILYNQILNSYSKNTMIGQSSWNNNNNNYQLLTTILNNGILPSNDMKKIPLIGVNISNLMDTKLSVLANYESKLRDSTSNISSIQSQLNKISSIKTTYQQELQNKLFDNIDAHIITSPTSVIETQENIVKYINDNELYKNLWKTYIQQISTTNTFDNIHLSMSIFELESVNKDKSNGCELISLFYNNIMKKIMTDYEESSPYYNDSNYVLDIIIDLIAFCIKEFVCESLFNSVLKESTKFILHIDQKNISTNITSVNAIVNDELKKIILEKLPLLITKIILKKFEPEDSDQKYENVENILKDIYVKISFNKDISIENKSTLITNLKDKIFPYYQKLFEVIIPDMKKIIDNYNNFIMMQSRFLDIYLTLNKKI